MKLQVFTDQVDAISAFQELKLFIFSLELLTIVVALAGLKYLHQIYTCKQFRK